MLSFARSLIVLSILSAAQASLFVTFPVQGDTCAVSAPCQIKWKDDPKAPSTSTFGETTIDLVMGNASNLQAVQNLGGVSNPGVATALTFTPIPALSPTHQYAIRFIFKGNLSNPIFSTFFSITGGSGTAKPITTPNSAAGSPAATIGNKANNVSATNSSAVKTNSLNATNSTSQPASENASQSAASSVAAPFYATVLLLSLAAFL